MNLHPSVLLALLGALLLTQCGEASNNRCGETTSSQFECGSDAACVWAGDEGSECRPKCESYDECASGEYCGPRAVPTSDAELLSANVCLPNALIELPQSQAEIEEFERACRARDLDDCERDPRCQWEYAEKLNLEAQCRDAGRLQGASHPLHPFNPSVRELPRGALHLRNGLRQRVVHPSLSRIRHAPLRAPIRRRNRSLRLAPV